MGTMMELVAPCHFGMEAVLKREILDLGYDISQVEDGRVTFLGDPEAVAYANIHLRTAERVLLKVAKFRATTFEELFVKTRSLPWEDYLPENARFWVAKATSVKSSLFSPSDIQSIMKKAIVERLKGTYHRQWFPEDGAAYPLRVSFLKDEALIGLDTSGDSLHKRGYRLASGKAPITETLAAALIGMTPWRGDRILVDPFCGSGTIPIEAAMMAAKIAPGMRRAFLAEQWAHLVPARLWAEVRNEAEEMADLQIDMDIQGYDIDGEILKVARENAKRAQVGHLIHFQERPVKELRHPKKYGFVITNPPYGGRLDGAELPRIYREMGEAFRHLDGWSEYVITAYPDAEKAIGKKADKNRKIYNGMIQTYVYQFFGPKPPKPKKKIESIHDEVAKEN